MLGPDHRDDHVLEDSIEDIENLKINLGGDRDAMELPCRCEALSGPTVAYSGSLGTGWRAQWGFGAACCSAATVSCMAAQIIREKSG